MTSASTLKNYRKNKLNPKQAEGRTKISKPYEIQKRKISETQSFFFLKRINKIDQSIVSLIRKKRERPKLPIPKMKEAPLLQIPQMIGLPLGKST